MADTDLQALFLPRDPERDNPTAVSSVLGYLRSAESKGSGSYKSLALVFRL